MVSPVPPFEQIRAQLSDLIRAGALHHGQRLPSIRQLAGDLRVSTGTVARAYSELQAAGLLETSRAAGARVCGGEAFTEAIVSAATGYVEAARAGDLSLEDALAAVRAHWQAPGAPGQASSSSVKGHSNGE